MGQKFSFRAQALEKFGQDIKVRHFINIAKDQNDQVDLDKSTYEETTARAIVWFPTKAGFPRGGGRPGMGALMQYAPEGILVREDYAAWIKSEVAADKDDHILVGNKTYRIFIRQAPVVDCGLNLLILREMVGGAD